MDVLPLPVILKTEENAGHSPQKVDVIDLDDYESTEDKIAKWNVKVRDRIKRSFGIECEVTLESLMKWYKETLFEEIFNIEISHRFIFYMEKHLQYFHSYFKELNWIFTDDYLDLMEDILAFYLDCEGKLFVKEKTKQKRNKKRIRKRLLLILRVYLLDQEERVHHVLMKMRLNLSSQEAKNYLDNIYRVVFSQKQKNKSDAAYCRAFILYQKWKKIIDSSMWNTLDEMLHETYSRSPDSIQSNSIWKEISPNQDSLIEILAQIGENDKIISDMYFRFMKSNVQENMNLLGESQINIDEQSCSTCDVERGVENSEFQSLMESCSAVSNNENDFAIKDELNYDSEDDCIIVPEGSHEIDPQEVVYEILDDDEDDDIVEITHLKLSEPLPRINRQKVDKEISFLDSIDITDNDVNKDSNSAKNTMRINSVPSPVPKLHNSDNDSVKSREILSRKFTRKKETVERPLDVPVKLNNKSELSKSDLVKPIQSFEDIHRLYDIADVHLDELESNNVHSPHSTFSSNSFKSNEIRTTQGKTTEEKFSGHGSPGSTEAMPSGCRSPRSPEARPNSPKSTEVSSSPRSPEFRFKDFSSSKSPDINFSGFTPPKSVELRTSNFNSAKSMDVGSSGLNGFNSPKQTEVRSSGFGSPKLSEVRSSGFSSPKLIEVKSSSFSSPTLIEVRSSGLSSPKLTEIRSSDFSSPKSPEARSSSFSSAKSTGVKSSSCTSPKSTEVKSSSCSSPKSTEVKFSSCSSPKSTEVRLGGSPRAISRETYISTSSPDISSTCDLNVDPQEEELELIGHRTESQEKQDEQSEPQIESSRTEDPIQPVVSPLVNSGKEVLSPKKKVRLNGSPVRVESTKSLELGAVSSIKASDTKLMTSRQLSVTVPRMEVLYTQKVKRLDEVHMRYNDLKGGLSLDDCFSGDIEKIDPRNVTSIAGFDLYADSQPSENRVVSSSPQNTSSPIEVVSPAYDGIDDFKTYFLNLQETNKSDKNNSRTRDINVQGKENIVDKSDKKKSVLLPTPVAGVKTKPIKRKRIAFAKEDIVDCVNTHKPVIRTDNVQIQGILKKRTEIPRIPFEHMNLRSLAYYGVRPNDLCLQSKPQVIVERLSEMEIKAWQEKTRKKRSESVSSSFLSSKVSSTMTLFRVTYDKSTPWLTENDTVHYTVQDDMKWRTQNSKKGEVLEEGRLVYTGRNTGKRKRESKEEPEEPVIKTRGKRGRPKKKNW